MNSVSLSQTYQLPATNVYLEGANCELGAPIFFS